MRANGLRLTGDLLVCAGIKIVHVRWSALSAQRFAVDKWSLCRVVV
jgi:hypothetical protein